MRWEYYMEVHRAQSHGTNNHSFTRSLNDESTNHDVVAGLHKAASANIAKN